MLQTQEMLLLLDCKRRKTTGEVLKWVPVQMWLKNLSLFSWRHRGPCGLCSSWDDHKCWKVLDNFWGAFWPHAFELGQSILLPKRGRIEGARAFAFKRLPIILKRILDQSQASWVLPWTGCVSLGKKCPVKPLFPQTPVLDSAHQNHWRALRIQIPGPSTEALVRQVWGLYF